MEGKIIGVGFQKTGTSSLREALKILGYRVKDTSSRPLIPILRGDFDRVLRMLRNYDAVEDTPWYMIYKELDQRIPGSKFILTLRDEESWFQSVSRHTGFLRSASHEWIYGRGMGLPKDHLFQPQCRCQGIFQGPSRRFTDRRLHKGRRMGAIMRIPRKRSSGSRLSPCQ